MNVAFNRDCLEAMKEMDDNAFELAIVDPPYGISINHSMGRRAGQVASGHSKVQWDDETPSADYFNELFRVSVNQVIWGGNYFMSKIARDSACWLLWDKKYSFDVSFAQYEMAWTSFPTSAKKFEMVNNGAGKIHPTQKPVELYKWILTHYANPSDRVLDTHLGSGSSRIACYDLGFDFVGYELDADYFQAQEERFARHTAQQTLFVPESKPVQEAMFV